MHTVRDIKKRYSVSEHTVLGWIRAGELKAVNVGRQAGGKKPRWRVTQAALDAFETARTPTVEKSPRVTRKRANKGMAVVEFY